MASNPALTTPAVESIDRSLSELCLSDEHFSWESPRRFLGFGKRLQLVLNQLLRSSLENLPPSVQTALKGIAGDLRKAVETVSVYRNTSKIFVLINCRSLCSSLQQHTVAIGGWLALLDSALHDLPDLRKKIADLSRDMKRVQFIVTENEERVHCILQKEGEGRRTTKAVQSAIIMDLARALGIESDNHAELMEQVKLLKVDISRSNLASERRILISLQRILDNWSTVPDSSTLDFEQDFADDAHILPFKNFMCPLTKEVMKDPVVLESSQNYERTAIEYWFTRCLEDGRDPTCPVTGQVLKSLELKPNIGLAGAIEEWVNRNIEFQVKSAVQYLSEIPPSVDCIEHVLENVYRISEEHGSSRYRLRNAGIVVLTVKVLRNSSKSIGTHLRTKALMVLLSMAKDEESKNIMLEEGLTRLAIHSLIGSSDKEREYAVKLLLEFSSDEAYCTRITSEKGALVLLSTMAGDLEYPILANLAEEVLKRMERVDENIQHLAAAGRFEPLLSRLCQGPDNVKIEMASMVGRMALTNSSKEQIARQSAKILVELLSKPEGRAASLVALYNLSTLDDNATILVDCSVLPALTDILFKNQDASPEMKELSASTVANIVSNPGHWELASVDKEGHSMQSESIVFGLLGLLSLSSGLCQVSILHILYGIASSPQASDFITLLPTWFSTVSVDKSDWGLNKTSPPLKPPPPSLNGGHREGDATNGVGEEDDFDPGAPPPFRLAEIRAAIPKHCWVKDPWRSLSYVARDVFVVFGLAAAAIYFNNWVVWPFYWAAQGTMFWALFVLGHDCGHGSFSDIPKLNSVVGHVLHSSILVPYHGWRISHRTHHQNHGHVENDESWVPLPEKLYKKLDITSRILRFTVPFPIFAYPFYLWTRSPGKKGSHFNPYSDLFVPSERKNVVTSTVCWTLMVALLICASFIVGVVPVLKIYGVPYLIFIMWLDFTTYLHHHGHEQKLPWYRGKEWNYLRGGLTTVDRDYGWFNNIHHDIGTHVIHHLFPQIPHYHLIEATKAAKPVLGKYYREPKKSGPIPLHLIKNLVGSMKQDHYVSDTGDVLYYQTDPQLYGFQRSKSE